MADKEDAFSRTFNLLRRNCLNRLHFVKMENNEVLIRSDIKTAEEAKAFVEAYEFVTKTRYRIYKVHSRLWHDFNKSWACHGNHRQLTKTARNLELHKKSCTSKIQIKVKRINKSTRKKDVFLKLKNPLLAEIRIHPKHNHPTMCEEYLNLLKVSKEVKECFYEYFANGIVGLAAKRHHLQNLMEANVKYLDDRSINPRIHSIYTMYRKWKLKNKAASRVQSHDPGVPVSEDDVDTRIGFLNVIKMLSKFENQPNSKDFSLEKMDEEIAADLERVKKGPAPYVPPIKIKEYGSVIIPPMPLIVCGIIPNCASSLPILQNINTRDESVMDIKSVTEAVNIVIKPDIEAKKIAVKSNVQSVKVTTKLDDEVMKTDIKPDIETIKIGTKPDTEAEKMDINADIRTLKIKQEPGTCATNVTPVPLINCFTVLSQNFDQNHHRMTKKEKTIHYVPIAPKPVQTPHISKPLSTIYLPSSISQTIVLQGAQILKMQLEKHNSKV